MPAAFGAASLGAASLGGASFGVAALAGAAAGAGGCLFYFLRSATVSLIFLISSVHPELHLDLTLLACSKTALAALSTASVAAFFASPADLPLAAASDAS